MKYYKWSLKWSYNRSDNHVFYKPNNSGYTTDLNEAGEYSKDEIGDCRNVINTKEDFKKAKNDNGHHPLYAVPTNKVNLLGKIMKCVRN